MANKQKIENLGRRAIEIIKNKWGLPKSGFIAGGSISNIVWELISGNKAVVNDIDVFLFDGVLEKKLDGDKKSLFKYKEIEKKYYENYTGMSFRITTKDFYSIVESTRSDIFNYIKYKSNLNNPDIILHSFDINCTKIGYSIDEDKIYYTQDFEDFLKSGELKVCNLMTPSHTALRLGKKKKDLNCSLDKFEYKLVQHALDFRFNDIIKIRFQEKYFDMYQELKSEISEYFDIMRDLDSENYVKLNFNKEVNLWILNPIKEYELFNYNRGIFTDSNIQKIQNSINFLFYIRNIMGNKKLEEIWSKFSYYFDSLDYIDKDLEKEDLELLDRFSKFAPNSIENLKGLKISEQVNLIKKILKRYEDNPIVGISILEKHKFDKDIELDDNDILLLELSVRKQILNDTKDKVNKILNSKIEKKERNTINIDDIF
jgi:hypothetical protein